MAQQPPGRFERTMQRAEEIYRDTNPSLRGALAGAVILFLIITMHAAARTADIVERYFVNQVSRGYKSTISLEQKAFGVTRNVVQTSAETATNVSRTVYDGVRSTFGYETDIWSKCLPVAGVVKDPYVLDNMRRVLPIRKPHVAIELKYRKQRIFAALEFEGKTTVTRRRPLRLGTYQVEMDTADARREDFEQGRIGCVVPYRTHYDTDLGQDRYILLQPGFSFLRGR